MPDPTLLGYPFVLGAVESKLTINQFSSSQFEVMTSCAQNSKKKIFWFGMHEQVIEGILGY